MNLNLDCVRDVLLFIESKKNLIVEDDGSVCFDGISLREMWSALPNRDMADIAYSLEILEEAGFLEMTDIRGDDHLLDAYVSRLTFLGHEYLETIRPETVWKKTLGILSKIGSYSISLAKDIAAEVLSSMLKDCLGIGQ